MWSRQFASVDIALQIQIGVGFDAAVVRMVVTPAAR